MAIGNKMLLKVWPRGMENVVADKRKGIYNSFFLKKKMSHALLLIYHEILTKRIMSVKNRFINSAP